MTDAFVILQDQHQAIHDAFSEFADTQDMRVATRICGLLMDHMHAEEAEVYPLLHEIDAPRAAECLAVHAEAKDLIARIQSSNGEGDAIEAVSLLGELVLPHIADEETRLFEHLRSTVSSSALTALGLRLVGR